LTPTAKPQIAKKGDAARPFVRVYCAKNTLNLKDFINDYLSFTRKDRIGILVLLALILTVYFFPLLRGWVLPLKPVVSDSSWLRSMQQLAGQEKTGAEPEGAYQVRNMNPGHRTHNNAAQPTLFCFDPNSLTEAGWKKLGLGDRIIQTIQHYRYRGGRFRKPGDLQKVYGLARSDFARLAPFIRIEDNSPTTAVSGSASGSPGKFITAAQRYVVVDINTADTAAFILLPGIGSRLAARIVNFREKLGGFYCIDQIGETYGLQDSVFQKLKPYLKLEQTLVRKIKLNSATQDELKTHPYIKWNTANAIIEYRNQHGQFISAGDLTKIRAIDPGILAKLINYVEL
jgi:DNA uptake protein ComE-like DNA-binding protein